MMEKLHIIFAYTYEIEFTADNKMNLQNADAICTECSFIVYLTLYVLLQTNYLKNIV